MGFEWGWADINWIAVVVAILANMVLGMVWYNKRVMGTIWMEDVGLDEQKIREGNMPLVWGSVIGLLVVTTIFIALVIENIGGGLEEGLVVGAVIGFGIAATNLIPHYSFSQAPWRLAIMNSINTGLAITLSGLIIGAFNE
ncbi:MAG: DUF1761 domain-containing protein [Dehalococcoidia bacterium]